MKRQFPHWIYQIPMGYFLSLIVQKYNPMRFKYSRGTLNISWYIKTITGILNSNGALKLFLGMTWGVIIEHLMTFQFLVTAVILDIGHGL